MLLTLGVIILIVLLLLRSVAFSVSLYKKSRGNRGSRVRRSRAYAPSLRHESHDDRLHAVIFKH